MDKEERAVLMMRFDGTFECAMRIKRRFPESVVVALDANEELEALYIDHVCVTEKVKRGVVLISETQGDVRVADDKDLEQARTHYVWW